MIYINSSSTNISIPCNTSKVFTQYTLTLRHRIAKVEYEYEVEDTMVSSLYYLFEQTFDIEVGEYDYILTDENGKTVASGLLQYGTQSEEPDVEKIYYQRERIIKIYNR